MENSASSDAVVREKIARLPPEVSETSHLEKIGSTDEGLKLLTQVITFTLDTLVRLDNMMMKISLDYN